MTNDLISETIKITKEETALSPQEEYVLEHALRFFAQRIRYDLLVIAGKGEYEDMRREVENYFQ